MELWRRRSPLAVRPQSDDLMLDGNVESSFWVVQKFLRVTARAAPGSCVIQMSSFQIAQDVLEELTRD
jgi:hypothetical protein